MYLGAPQVWPDAGGETAGFLLLNVPQPPKQLPKGCEAVGLATDEPPAGLFARLQAAAVARLQQDLDRAGWLTRALQARTPAQLMKQAAMMLQNPVILTTASYRVLAMEDGGLSFSDPVWAEAKQTGYCGAESVRLFENENITRQVLQSPGPLVLETGLACSNPPDFKQGGSRGPGVRLFWRVPGGAGLYPMGIWKRTAWVIRTLETMIEPSDLATWDEEAIGDSLIVDLLQGRLQQATLLNDRMRAAGWRPQRNFRCAVLLPDSPGKGHCQRRLLVAPVAPYLAAVPGRAVSKRAGCSAQFRPRGGPGTVRRPFAPISGRIRPVCGHQQRIQAADPAAGFAAAPPGRRCA